MFSVMDFCVYPVFLTFTTLYLFYWYRDCFSLIHQEFFIQLLYVYNFTVGMLLQNILRSSSHLSWGDLCETWRRVSFFFFWICFFDIYCRYRSSEAPEKLKSHFKCLSQRRIEECWYSHLYSLSSVYLSIREREEVRPERTCPCNLHFLWLMSLMIPFKKKGYHRLMPFKYWL